jgi:hypothetical protein
MPILAGLTTYGIAASLLVYGLESGYINDDKADIYLGIMIGLGVLLALAAAIIPQVRRD